MASRDGYIPGVPCWVDTSQPDRDAAINFYASLFGWEFDSSTAPGSGGSYSIAQLRGGDVAAVGSIPDGAPRVATWNTYVSVRSADEIASKVERAGGTTHSTPFDVLDAGRMASFADPEGAQFCVWEARRHIGARIVNEPGALTFNGLNTRDVEAARSFYGSVFGWETLLLEGGVELWTLPGYGDHLELSDPGLRGRITSMGAHPDFADVVASITPIAAAQPDPPAHWSVTFTVEDADRTAQRAIELGGRLIVAPVDAPWSRLAVIADPQGATFIASQFAPQNRDVPASPRVVAGAL